MCFSVHLTFLFIFLSFSPRVCVRVYSNSFHSDPFHFSLCLPSFDGNDLLYTHFWPLSFAICNLRLSMNRQHPSPLPNKKRNEDRIKLMIIDVENNVILHDWKMMADIVIVIGFYAINIRVWCKNPSTSEKVAKKERNEKVTVSQETNLCDGSCHWNYLFVCWCRFRLLNLMRMREKALQVLFVRLCMCVIWGWAKSCRQIGRKWWKQRRRLKRVSDLTKTNYAKSISDL